MTSTSSPVSVIVGAGPGLGMSVAQRFGKSSVVPMPSLGGMALWAAALRNYAVTLHAAPAPVGIYAGTITIGGSIERSDIRQTMLENPDLLGVSLPTLNPDDLADILWRLYSDRTEPEAVVNAMAA